MARVGLRPEGRAPMREGTVVYAGAEGGEPIGAIATLLFAPDGRIHANGTLLGVVLVGHAGVALAGDTLTVKETKVDRPTLIHLGVQVRISDDDDRETCEQPARPAHASSLWRRP